MEFTKWSCQTIIDQINHTFDAFSSQRNENGHMDHGKYDIAEMIIVK
jgi:hypothetical protein